MDSSVVSFICRTFLDTLHILKNWAMPFLTFYVPENSYNFF